MSDWLILVDTPGDLSQAETRHKVMGVTDYLANPALFAGRRPYVLNLSRSYAYQSSGYYASLLAEARGHRVSPSVQTMVELSQKRLYAHALPELNLRLREARARGAPVVSDLLVAFSRPEIPSYERLAREVSDWFRVPALEIGFEARAPHEIAWIRPIPPHKLKDTRRSFFIDAMTAYTNGRPAAQRARPAARWSLAVLVDPNDPTPPSNAAALKRLADVAERMGVEVELLDPGDLPSLAEFDALFIRATTRIDNYTYRFARRAEQEGMPVIDDTASMIRCTNKVYLKELLENAGLPIPRTEIVDARTDLAGVVERLGLPVVLKMPDGSFGANMLKATDAVALKDGVVGMLKQSALVVAQAYVPTTFDWRIGILDGQALFACRYRMAPGHWQIVRRTEDGRMREGGAQTLPLSEVPERIVELALRAARLIGDGLYGIDLKETEAGVFIIEINDNPNLESHVEGAVIRDDLWRRLILWFEQRLEARIGRATGT